MKKLFTYAVALCVLAGLTLKQFSSNTSDTVYAKFKTSLFVPYPNTDFLNENCSSYDFENKSITSFTFKTVGVSSLLSKDCNAQIDCILKVQENSYTAYNSSIKKAVFLIKIFTSKYQSFHNIK